MLRYRLPSDAAQLAEEAVQGELIDYKFLTTSGDPTCQAPCLHSSRTVQGSWEGGAERFRQGVLPALDLGDGEARSLE